MSRVAGIIIKTKLSVFPRSVFLGLTCGSFAVSTDNAVAGAHHHRGFDPFIYPEMTWGVRRLTVLM